MTKANLFIFVVTFFFVSLVNAEMEQSTACDSRVPQISLSQAIRLVIEHNKVSDQNDTKIVIDEAKLRCQNKRLIWLIGYRQQSFESGHTYVIVSMDSNVTFHSVVKDG